jgi:hypothetical protein
MEDLRQEDIPATMPESPKDLYTEVLPANIPERKKTEKRVIVEEDEVDKQDIPKEQKPKKKKKKLAGTYIPSQVCVL